MEMQAKGLQKKEIFIKYSGKGHRFLWGTAFDVGDGRLMLVIVNGKPEIYNSVSEYCEPCQHVAFTPKVDNSQCSELNKSFVKKEGESNQ
jgi:hypothetical protein